METANKGCKQNFISRLSRIQKGILAFLETRPKVPGSYIGNLPGNGEIIDALGGERTASKYVIVSKSLRRLEGRGMVDVYTAGVRLRGNGYRYALSEKYKAFRSGTV